jgi:uncharacterized membrane protein YgcG
LQPRRRRVPRLQLPPAQKAARPPLQLLRRRRAEAVHVAAQHAEQRVGAYARRCSAAAPPSGATGTAVAAAATAAVPAAAACRLDWRRQHGQGEGAPLVVADVKHGKAQGDQLGPTQRIDSCGRRGSRSRGRGCCGGDNGGGASGGHGKRRRPRLGLVAVFGVRRGLVFGAAGVPRFAHGGRGHGALNAHY